MSHNKYCPSCGEKLDGVYILCPQCGENLREWDEKTNDEHPGKTVNPQTESLDFNRPDHTLLLFGLLGFFLPIIGLILYFVWLEERPRIAKAVGAGALASVVVGLLLVMFLATIAGSQTAFIV